MRGHFPYLTNGEVILGEEKNLIFCGDFSAFPQNNKFLGTGIFVANEVKIFGSVRFFAPLRMTNSARENLFWRPKLDLKGGCSGFVR